MMLFPNSDGDRVLCGSIRRITNGYVVSVGDMLGTREIIATTLEEALAIVVFRDREYRVGDRPTVTIGVETSAEERARREAAQRLSDKYDADGEKIVAARIAYPWFDPTVHCAACGRLLHSGACVRE